MFTPYLAIARELMGRGHEVFLLTNPAFEKVCGQRINSFRSHRSIARLVRSPKRSSGT